MGFSLIKLPNYQRKYPQNCFLSSKGKKKIEQTPLKKNDAKPLPGKTPQTPTRHFTLPSKDSIETLPLGPIFTSGLQKQKRKKGLRYSSKKNI